MQLLIVFVVFVLVLLFGIVVRVVTSDLNESDRPVAFKVKLEVSEDKCDDGSPTGNMSPRMRRQGVHRRKRGVGEVSHYAKMHSRTRYRI